MSALKQLFEKMRKTGDKKKNSKVDDEYKYDNLLRQNKKQGLNENLHNVIRETTTGIAF